MLKTSDLGFLEAPRAFLTGASGFIGSHMVRHLRQHGWRVAVIARPNAAKKLEHNPDIETVFTYTGSTSGVVHAMNAFQPHCVFHLAALVLSQHDPELIPELISANVLFGTQILEAMQQCGVKLLINSGTSWQHFSGNHFNPVNLYASTKQAFEDILLYYVETSGFSAITLKLFDSYGPGDRRPKILRSLIESMRQGQPLDASPGEQILDLVHVEDICCAFRHASTLVAKHQKPALLSYAVSGSQHRTLREVAATIERVIGRPLNIHWGGRSYRSREVMIPWDGPRLPQWEPKYSLEEGIREIVETEYPDLLTFECSRKALG